MEFYGVVIICCNHISWWCLKYHESKATLGFMRHFENSEAWSAGSQDLCTLPHFQLNHFHISIQWLSDWMCHETQTEWCMPLSNDRGHFLQALRNVAQWPNTVESLEDPLVGFDQVVGLKTLDVLRWVEMDFLFHPTTFITANMNHQSQSAESTYNLLILWFFHIISPWFLKCWFCLIQCRFLFSWPFQPRWGGLITRLARSTAKRCDAIWPAPENFQRNTEQKHFFVTGAIGCEWVPFLYISVMFQGLDEDTWKSEKGDDYKAGCFFGDQKSMYEEFSPKWTSKRR